MILKSFLSIVLLLTFSSNGAIAMSPDEYCDIHNESKAPGECETKGDCAVIYTNLGTEECKLCSDGGCTLADCSKCEEEK